MTSSEWPRSTRRAKQREEPLDVGEVEAGRRLVEDEERVRLALAAEVRGELQRCASPPESVESGWPRRR